MAELRRTRTEEHPGVLERECSGDLCGRSWNAMTGGFASTAQGSRSSCEQNSGNNDGDRKR